jgi:hypothetical protein
MFAFIRLCDREPLSEEEFELWRNEERAVLAYAHPSLHKT